MSTPVEALTAWQDEREEAQRQRARLDAVKAQVAEELRREVAALEREAHERHVQQARALYGRGGVLGGGARSATSQREDPVADFARRFNGAQRDSYGQRLGLSTHDVDVFASTRFLESVKADVRQAARR